MIDKTHMYKPLAVILIGVAALTGVAKPVAITKADVATLDPMANAISALSQDIYTVVPMRITAYSSSADETDYNPFYTANGTHVRDGIVASNLFPFGTKIEIPALFGNKVFTVDDRMAKRFQKTIDIWMSSKEKALVFGVTNTQVVVLGTTTLASYNPPAGKDITANLR